MSDNGGPGGKNNQQLDANGGLRGNKGMIYEGGIRVPTVAWWPGKIASGSQSDHAASFSDFMATACEMSGETTPKNTTSVSFLPSLLGDDAAQKKKEVLYWEFYEKVSSQAVRFGKWKAIRKPIHKGTVTLFDLSKDLGEENDLNKAHPEIVKQAKDYMKREHVNNPNWQPKGKKK